MHLTFHRTPMHAWMTSAVLLAGLTACSRSDRADGSSQDQTGTATTADTAAAAGTQGVVGTAGVDTQASARDTAMSHGTPTTERPLAEGTAQRKTRPSRSTPAPDTGVSGYQSMASDTAASTSAARSNDTAISTDTTSPEMVGASADTVAVGDSANIGKTGERLEPTESSQQANADTLADQSESDRVRPPEDSSEVLGSVTTPDSLAASSDTSVTASTEMARDTSTAVAQADTSVQVQVDTTTQIGDTGSVTPADTGVAVQAQMDTTTAGQQTDVAAQAQDTSIVVGDSTEMGKPGERLEPSQTSEQANADTAATEADRVRPPEDSTEMLGNVTTEEDRAKNQAESAADQAPAAAAGAQATGGMVTGAAAVAQVTREGRRCAVVQSGESEGDSEEDIRWDLAGSPATMNPCGTGTMTLPRIQMEE